MLLTATRLGCAALLVTVAAGASTTDNLPPQPAEGPVERLVLETSDPALRALAQEALARNPGLLAASGRYRAALLEAPQARALPDPMLEVTAFALSPETRVGPQELMVGVSQALPWSGKRGLKAKEAALAAAALEGEVQADRIALLTEVRRLYYELLFVDRHIEIAGTFREHLLQHEEISQARYATGVGSAQAVVKLQAEITRVDSDLLALDARLIELSARVNRLRDRPAATPVERAALPQLAEVPFDAAALKERATRLRPELRAADARISRAGVMEELAFKDYRPDFVVGLSYTLVEPRDDPAARQMPPADNGDDIIGLRGGVRIPAWRSKLEAGVEQAVEMQLFESAAKRDLVLAIESRIDDLAQRLPLAWRQLRLTEDLLVVQAEESLESAQAGYIAGTLNALDLLDAEHIVVEAHTAAARAKTDYLVGLAELEGAVGEPLGRME